MEHFNDSLNVPFFDATTKKCNPSSPKPKLSCQGIFPVLDAGTDLGFSLRGLLLVKTKKVVPA